MKLIIKREKKKKPKTTINTSFHALHYLLNIIWLGSLPNCFIYRSNSSMAKNSEQL